MNFRMLKKGSVRDACSSGLMCSHVLNAQTDVGILRKWTKNAHKECTLDSFFKPSPRHLLLLALQGLVLACDRAWYDVCWGCNVLYTLHIIEIVVSSSANSLNIIKLHMYVLCSKYFDDRLSANQKTALITRIAGNFSVVQILVALAGGRTHVHRYNTNC